MVGVPGLAIDPYAIKGLNGLENQRQLHNCCGVT